MFWRDWSEIKVTFSGKVINLPKSITVKLRDKFKVRHMMGSQPILFHLMLKQGFNWFTLTPKEQEIENVQLNQFNITENGKRDQPHVRLYLWFNMSMLTNRHGGCRIDHKNGEGHIHLLQRSHCRIHYPLSVEQKYNSLSFFKTKNSSF